MRPAYSIMKTMGGPGEEGPCPRSSLGLLPYFFSYIFLLSTPLLYLETDTEADGEGGRLVVPAVCPPSNVAYAGPYFGTIHVWGLIIF